MTQQQLKEKIIEILKEEIPCEKCRWEENRCCRYNKMERIEKWRNCLAYEEKIQCECMKFNTCRTGFPSIDCNCKCHPKVKPLKEDCNCYDYPADWDSKNHGWKCLNCGKVNKCKIGGVDIKCCPDAPHPKPLKESWEIEYDNLGESNYGTVKDFIRKIAKEQYETGYDDCLNHIDLTAKVMNFEKEWEMIKTKTFKNYGKT